MPILYEGELIPNTTFFGQVAEPTFEAGNDDFWWFFGNAGDVVTITVNRLENALDLAFYLLQGVGGDTDDLLVLAFRDDDIPELPGFEGPFLDPQLLNYTLPSTGFYTIWVRSFASVSPGPDEVYDYQITLGVRQPIPEPYSLSLFGLGLLGLAFRQKARR